MHLLDLELERLVGDDEARPGVVDAEREVLARSMSEHGTATSPLLSAPSIAPCQSGTFPSTTSTRPPIEPQQEMRPAGGVPGHVRERAPVDDALAVDERERGAERVGRERIDHVAREVEARRDVPPRGVRPRMPDLGLRPSAEQGH